MMKHLTVCVALIALAAACTTSDAAGDTTNKKTSLEEKLGPYERTGEYRNCVPLRQIRSTNAVDDRHILVRVGSDYYLNRLSGRCAGIDRNFNRIQYKTSLNQLCQNEIITVVDNSQGFTIGSCGLGKFEKLLKVEASPETNRLKDY